LVHSALGVFAAELDDHILGRCAGTSSRPFLPLPPDLALNDADWR
jgi:hypothetical protein